MGYAKQLGLRIRVGLVLGLWQWLGLGLGLGTIHTHHEHSMEDIALYYDCNLPACSAVHDVLVSVLGLGIRSLSPCVVIGCRLVSVMCNAVRVV